MAELDETTYPMGAVAKLTGLSPDVLRAWERRHGVIEPLRTEGGTRRYRESDLDRLRLVKAAVDAGHRISEVARLSGVELERRAAPAPSGARHSFALDEVIGALRRFDAVSAEQIISTQLAALGPVRFAREFALPLVEAMGDGWEHKRLCVASEHLGSSLLRSALGACMRTTLVHRAAPTVVFGTPPGERHELGLLMAALTALGAGANPIFLGSDLPGDELLGAVSTSQAQALALSLVILPREEAEREVDSLRDALPRDCELWVGGARALQIELPYGVSRIDSLASLERSVERLCTRRR